MRKHVLLLLMMVCKICHASLPEGFVYLSDIEPSILQDIRFAGIHNITGQPLQGYTKSSCKLKKEAAIKLKKAQEQLKRVGYSLKVYDCYRPQKAILQLVEWAKGRDETMKREFFPHLSKNSLLKRHYITSNSPHNQGISVDVTIIATKPFNNIEYRHGQHLVACDADNKRRLFDGSLDMGTGYACFDKASAFSFRELSLNQRENRLILANLMKQHGFIPSRHEWWHFTLANASLAQGTMDFDIV